MCRTRDTKDPVVAAPPRAARKNNVREQLSTCLQFWPISPSMPASLSLQPAGPAETAIGFATIADVSTVQCLASSAEMRSERSLAVADERQTPSKSAKAVAWVAPRRCAQEQGCNGRAGQGGAGQGAAQRQLQGSLRQGSMHPRSPRSRRGEARTRSSQTIERASLPLTYRQ